MMNNAYQNVYQSFAHAKQIIQCIAPIDYFFAKEMLQALTPQLSKEEESFGSTNVESTNVESTNLESGNVESSNVEGSDVNGSGINSSTIKSTEDVALTLMHVFLALSDSLRSGHACLPLTSIASKSWGYSAETQSTHYQDVSSQGSGSDDISSESSVHLELSSQGSASQGLSTQGIRFPDYATLTSLFNSLSLSATAYQPIVFEKDKLYLRRYYQFESELALDINARLVSSNQFSDNIIKQLLVQLFPEQAAENTIRDQIDDVDHIDWQKVAVANAINKNFSVIAGGPGTGKTYTVTKLLAALVMLHNNAKLSQTSENNLSKLNIALVAPTGKAAQRLSESLVNAIAGFSGLITDDVLNHIPTNAQTIHRLLGVIPNSPNFRHHQDNKLAYDVVLIDEVSMVDLPLMTRVFRALKPYCKVILLGDADQLPSVAAGSVLADIAPRPHGGFSEQNISYVSTVCQIDADLLQRGLLPSANQANTGQVNTDQLSAEQSKTIPLINAKLKTNDYLTYLVKSRRFDGKGGIGLLAKAVIEGDGRNSWRLLSEAKGKGSKQLALASSELSVWLPPLIRKYYQPLEKCSHVIDAFALLAKFRVLCATRKGPFGVETINEYIQGYLGKHSFNQSNHKNGQQALYHGQPIMISENNYRLGLYNGDIGIIWRVTDTDGKEHLMACFESTEAEQAGVENTGKICETQAIRHILPSRLPKFETVYAMTIHKTQGSEFDHVAMLLSAGEGDVNRAKGKVNKLLSRELLYTAITRAKTQLTVGSDQFTWQQGVTGQVIRHSGLTLT